MGNCKVSNIEQGNLGVSGTIPGAVYPSVKRALRRECYEAKVAIGNPGVRSCNSWDLISDEENRVTQNNSKQP